MYVKLRDSVTVRTSEKDIELEFVKGVVFEAVEVLLFVAEVDEVSVELSVSESVADPVTLGVRDRETERDLGGVLDIVNEKLGEGVREGVGVCVRDPLVKLKVRVNVEDGERVAVVVALPDISLLDVPETVELDDDVSDADWNCVNV